MLEVVCKGLRAGIQKQEAISKKLVPRRKKLKA